MENISKGTVRRQDYELANCYKIDKFEPFDFVNVTGGVVGIIAETGSGKTVLLKDILSRIHKNYDKIHLMSRTARLQKAYDFFPRSLITDDYDEELMTDIWNTQVKNHKEGKPVENVLVILDDIIASPSFKKSKMIKEAAFGARHLNITIIILSQYFVAIKPEIRENMRIAIAFQMTNKREREKFINQFLSADTFGAGELLFRRITDEKYQCIIVEKYKSGEPISAKVKKYIADPNVVIKMKDPEEEAMTLRNKEREEMKQIRTITVNRKKTTRINGQGTTDKYGI